MSIRSESVLSASPAVGNPNLVPVADVLPEEFAQLDFDYVGDFEITLMVDPGLPKPYYTEVNGDLREEFSSLVEAQQGFEDLTADLREAVAEKGGVR
jgi:hypothetical protein